MVYRKENPSDVQIVNKMKYHVLIYDGWGLVSAAKIARRTRALLDKMDVDFNQFWELVLSTFPDPVRSKRWFREALDGKISDSQVDFLLLHVLTTVTRQPLSYFTQGQDRVPVHPWKHWDLTAALQTAQEIRWFEITYEVNEKPGQRSLSAHDETHARGIWMARYPHSKILQVRELPATPGTEIG
jgi:hypothetical protein